MTLSNRLLTLADWLENHENELIATADDKHIDVLAMTLTKASQALREGAQEIEQTEEAIITVITPETLDEMAAIASEFEASGDELLKKQASVLDEILFTLAVPKNAIYQAKEAQDKKIDELKKKYQDVKKDLDEVNKVADAEKALKESPVFKDARPLEYPLSTRMCPNHMAPLARVGENSYRCSLAGEVFNWEQGWTANDGTKVPGGNVNLQIPLSRDVGRVPFETQVDTRSDRMGTKKD